MLTSPRFLVVSLKQNVRLGLNAARMTMAAAALLIVEHVEQEKAVLITTVNLVPLKQNVR
jgi:hypothetical protein